jgi:putative transposase
MARPFRIEYPGAVYHVTSRGDRREPIAKDDMDRAAYFDVLGQALERSDAKVRAYCLMGNHYHLVLHTPVANLSRLMRQINGVYTQAFNRRHRLVGHLFQGRFKAILVDSDSYLLQVCRYVDLNPVRAAMVASPDAYHWSSYRALIGLVNKPDWLDTNPLYEQLAPGGSADHAAHKYAEFVAEGHGVPLWVDNLKQQIYLGDEAFINRMQAHADFTAGTSKSKPSQIHSAAPPRSSDIKRFLPSPEAKTAEPKSARNQRIHQAFYAGGHSQTEIAAAFHVSSSTECRVVLAGGRRTDSDD